MGLSYSTARISLNASVESAGDDNCVRTAIGRLIGRLRQQSIFRISWDEDWMEVDGEDGATKTQMLVGVMIGRRASQWECWYLNRAR